MVQCIAGNSPSKRIKEIRLAVAGAITLANTNLRDKTTYKFSLEKNAQNILETKQFDSNWIRKYVKVFGMCGWV